MALYSIFGYGKGKTEAAVGMTIRALANGEQVLFAQFLKDGSSSEIKYLKDKVDVLTSSINYAVLPQNKTCDDIDDCAELYRKIFNNIATGKYNLIVLDEVLVALDIGLISFSMLDLLLNECKSVGADVYMTGRVRNAETRQHITNISDCVTNAYCEKHIRNRYCSYCHNEFPFHYTYCPDCGSELGLASDVKIGRDF